MKKKEEKKEFQPVNGDDLVVFIQDDAAKKQIHQKIKKVRKTREPKKIVLKEFAALDFETANRYPTSICSVGVVIVKDGQIIDKIYHLVKPEPEFYNYFNTRIHGLSDKDTQNARNFKEVWTEIDKKIGNLPLVAHNNVFERGCLKAAHQMYQMYYPNYPIHCTCQGSRKVYPDLENHKLNTVAAHCGYDLTNHHNALADAEACAYIAMKVFAE
ncbi:MAG: polC [Bacteroidetes bacterium]|nr:polC [Bacteroidota bacterium]